MSKEGLQKTLGSLSYYIEKASHHILTSQSPLELDSSNGSWLAKQSVNPLSSKVNSDQTQAFYSKHACMALTVPVVINVFGIEQVLLDTIDEVDEKAMRLHCNQHGWFHFDGRHIQQSSSQNEVDLMNVGASSITSTVKTSPNSSRLLLKPSKVSMSAACCGHQWKNQQRMASRALSLRELLLTTRVNWKKLSQPLPLKRFS